MIRILTGVKVRHAPGAAILRQKTASKGSKGIEVREGGERRASGRASGSERVPLSERPEIFDDAVDGADGRDGAGGLVAAERCGGAAAKLKA